MSNYILHPELFDSIPMTGVLTKQFIASNASKISSQSTLGLPEVSIVIRTLNEREGLEGLFEDLGNQAFGSDSQVVVVDNESTDGTPEVAKTFGATLITIPRNEFTYPKSMNLGMEASDNNAVLLTVGHARLTTTRLVHAVAKSLHNRGIGGVYGTTQPSFTTSWIESLISMGNVITAKKALNIKKSGLGVLGATCAGISKEAWEELGRFDERYESGGEDTAFAAKILDSDRKVLRDPLLSVHHSHGLGLVDTIKQWNHWVKTVKGPVPLNLEELQTRRPDIDNS